METKNINIKDPLASKPIDEDIEDWCAKTSIVRYL